MVKRRLYAVLILIVGVALSAFINYSQQSNRGFISNFPFKLGLDLNGGTHLVYQADTTKLAKEDIGGAMQSLRNVINARINALGVSEPIIQTEKATVNGVDIHKLIVELPGVTDIKQAVDSIGKTPVLEFKRLNPNAPVITASSTQAEFDAQFLTTDLTGRYLDTAAVQFDQQTNRPVIALSFNSEGKELFAKITEQEIGKPVAISLDGIILSAPTVREPITDGRAVISGDFTLQEARDLVRGLKYGALPVPVELIGTQSIGASLGADAIRASVQAGIWGFILTALFLLLWYRLPGLVAVISLTLYVILNLALFKLLGVVLTSAGLAAFIISLGMAVDGNILIFERMREELEKGKVRGLSVEQGIKEGFSRAWLSIRDSNMSSIITALILFFTATSALVKGFAFVFFIGVAVSAFTAITVSRTLLLSLGAKEFKGKNLFWFGHGFSIKPKSHTK
jgi:protein-export membrane protein SecD